MIQRIQTIYLIIALITAGVLPFFFPLWIDHKEVPYYFFNNAVYVVLFGLSTVFSLLGILFYKNRKNQFVIGRLNIILNLILLGLFIYRSLSLSGEKIISEKDIGFFFPAISVFFLALANKAIKKDEDLVKSVDRLR